MTSQQKILSEDTSTLQNLLCQIQKSFKIVQQCIKTWNEVLTGCNPQVDSLNNLTEQFTASYNAEGDELVILTSSMLDVKDKLLYKIQEEVEAKLVTLQGQMSSLQGLCDRVTKQCNYSTNLYLKNHKQLDLVTVTTGTATRPSIANMLEWLQDTEQLLLQRFRARHHCLDQFRLLDKSTHLTDSKIWCGNDRDICKQIEDYLAYLSFFLEDKL